MPSSRQGFTLVEILAVVGVTAILASILVAGYRGVSRNGDKVREIAAGKTLIAAYQSYAADNNGRYLPSKDPTAGALSTGDGGSVSSEIASRYPFRLAPYFDYKMEGTILVNKNDQQIQKEATKGSSTYNYFVSLYPALGMTRYLVGGALVTRGRGSAQQTSVRYPNDCVTHQAQGYGSLLVFASGGTKDIDGYIYVDSPNIGDHPWTGSSWKEGSSPDSYGHIHPRYNGKAVCVFLNGSVRLLSMEDLDDMRLWSARAADVEDPDYKSPEVK